MAGTQTLDRSLDILFLVAGAAEPLAMGEIAAGTGVHESTAYRLVQALQQRGLLRREARGQVTLGPALFELARAADRQIGGDLPTLAGPFMEDLVRRTGETSFLTVRSGLEVVCVEVVESPRRVRLAFGKWQISPLYAGSAVTILAHQDQTVIDRVVAASRGRRYANGDPVTRERLVAAMERVRAEGHVVTSGEVDPDATGIGVPVFDGRGRAVAALSLAGPTSRIEGEALPALVEQVTKTGHALSTRLAAAWTDAGDSLATPYSADQRR